MRTKTIASLLLTLALLLILAPVAARHACAAWSGSGTATDPYRIGTADELRQFADIVNGTNNQTQNRSACGVLTADIDLANASWTPIGANGSFFGTFDGGSSRSAA